MIEIDQWLPGIKGRVGERQEANEFMGAPFGVTEHFYIFISLVFNDCMHLLKLWIIHLKLFKLVNFKINFLQIMP